MNLPNFKSLEEDGFIVLKNVITEKEIEMAKQIYYESKQSFVLNKFTDKNNYTIFSPTHCFSDKIKTILEKIAQDTPIKVDVVSSSGSYFDTELINLDWHQDHENYFRWQEAYHSLNLWIPIIKPNEDQGGLAVLPMTSLKEKFPEVTETHIIGKGAQLFMPLYAPEAKCKIIDKIENSKEQILKENILSCQIFPKIKVGDILIMRGDLIHASNKNQGARVALSIRCFSSNGVINKTEFLKMGQFKKTYMMRNPASYQRHVKKFEEEPNREIFSVLEILNTEPWPDEKYLNFQKLCSEHNTIDSKYNDSL